MDDPKVTTFDLMLAHEDWSKQMADKLHTLKLWGRWYRDTDGPARWGEFVHSVRRQMETSK